MAKIYTFPSGKVSEPVYYTVEDPHLNIVYHLEFASESEAIQYFTYYNYTLEDLD